MIRHPFAFLRYLIDFSIEKLEKCIEICETVTPDDAPEIEMQYQDLVNESMRQKTMDQVITDSRADNLCICPVNLKEL